jgi:hypothetical protein
MPSAHAPQRLKSISAEQSCRGSNVGRVVILFGWFQYDSGFALRQQETFQLSYRERRR